MSTEFAELQEFRSVVVVVENRNLLADVQVLSHFADGQIDAGEMNLVVDGKQLTQFAVERTVVADKHFVAGVELVQNT